MDHFEKIQDETGNQIQNFLTWLILNMFLTLCLFCTWQKQLTDQ